MKKNKKVLLRLNYFKNIKKKIVLKSLSKDQSLNPTIRGNLFYKKKKIFINKFNNICLITGNSNSVFKKFKMSRITFRTLAHKGLIPGISKSSW